MVEKYCRCPGCGQCDSAEKIARVQALIQNKRCSDHGCVWGHGGGMGTNGGCQHDKMDKHELRREIRSIAKELRSIVEEKGLR